MGGGESHENYRTLWVDQVNFIVSQSKNPLTFLPPSPLPPFQAINNNGF